MHVASWSYEFSHPPEEVWPQVSDTERENRMVRFGPIQFTTAPHSHGGSIRFGQMKVMGFCLKWVENPYEWVVNEYFQVERIYVSGPLAYMNVRWDFKRTKKGCIVTQTVHYNVRYGLLFPLAFIQAQIISRRAYLKYYASVDHALLTNHTSNLGRSDRGLSISTRTLRNLSERMTNVGIDRSEADAMLEWMFKAEDVDLLRIRPFKVAREWNKEKLGVLSNFLKSTQAGIFQLSWDVLCPNCRGAKSRVFKLLELQDEIHCDSCNIRFKTDFDRSVEVSFSPNPAVRKLDIGEYCIGGPQNTSHVLSQLRIPPHSSRKMKIRLPEGVTRIRSLQSREVILIHCYSQEEGSHSNTEHLFEFHGQAAAAVVDVNLKDSQLNAEFRNHCNFDITVITEKTAWLDDACTGAFITTLQDFRNYFSSEVLKSNQQIRISGIAILFVDLKSSTELYQSIGEVPAFVLVNQYIELFSKCVTAQNGAVVKTIGDSVMAAFYKPGEALEAAINMQKAVKAGHNEILIKVGIHFGPCFIASRGDYLDYFGTTVNIAARAEGQCEGGQIVITGSMMDHAEVKKVMKVHRLHAQQNIRKLRGLIQEFELYHLSVK